MSINPRFIKANQLSIVVDENQRLSQKPGTDGGEGQLKAEPSSVDSTMITLGYFQLTQEPINPDACLFFIEDASGNRSVLRYGIDITIVRDGIGGLFRRCCFDSTKIPGGVAIPDTGDLAPSIGVQSKIVSGEKFVTYYTA